jgi:hypothetical protein
MLNVFDRTPSRLTADEVGNARASNTNIDEKVMAARYLVESRGQTLSIWSWYEKTGFVRKRAS